MKNKFLTILMLTICGVSLASCDDNRNDKLPYEIDDSFKRQEMIAEEVKDCEKQSLTGELSDYKIIWSDEFNYTGTPDSSKWSYELGTGNGGWGNNELQTYTNRTDNAYVDNGNLTITAKREEYNGSDFTSARLVTKGKGDFTYGYIEMRAILAGGRGAWPAFWMMPTDSKYGTWPASGEIDIMEYVGNRKNYVLNTVHSEARYGGNGRGNTYFVNGVEESYHTYGLLWTEDYLKFYVDGIEKFKVTNGKLSRDNYKYWPYDENFFIILNVAMGGNLGGDIGDEFQETKMIVDYVRVYQQDLKGIDTMTPTPAVFNSYTSSSSSISLNWQKADDDYGIKQYEVIVNGKQVLATTRTTATIDNLEPNTSYTVQILALDKGGNFTVSNAISIKTTDILKAPGKIEIEQFVNGVGANILGNPNNSQSVDFTISHSVIPYIICEISASKAGNYNIECFLQGNRPSDLAIYIVNSQGEGTKTNTQRITNTFGSYQLINLDYNINLKEGINYIKIECIGSSDGKTTTIDYINLTIN